MAYKSKRAYVIELKGLMVDLSDAVENQDEEKISEIVELAKTILSDIEEADYEGI